MIQTLHYNFTFV